MPRKTLINARRVVQRRLKELGLTDAEAARRAGVSPDGLHRWLVGRRPTINTSTLERVAGSLGLVLAPKIPATRR